MNPRAGRWVKASFLQTQKVVSVRVVRIATWVCKLLFKVEMHLKYEDICLSLAASGLCVVLWCCSPASGEQDGGSGVWQDPHPEPCLHSFFWCLQSCEFQRCGKTFPKSPVHGELHEGRACTPLCLDLHQLLSGNPALLALCQDAQS